MFRILLVIVMFLLPGFATANPGKEVINRVNPAVGRVVVETEKGTGFGTGFVVGKADDGALYLVTNRHVIEGGTKIVVGFLVNGQVEAFTAYIVSATQELDLALLKIVASQDSAYRPPALSIYDEKLDKGDQVFALGYPGISAELTGNYFSRDAFDTTFTVGNVNKVAQGAWIANGSSVEQVQHTATVNKGNSGGPLLDYCGAIVGVNTWNVSSSSNVYVSSSSRTLLGFLQSFDIGSVTVSQPCDATSPKFAPITQMDERAPSGPLGLPIWGIVAGALVVIGAVGGVVAYKTQGASPDLMQGDTGMVAVVGAKPAMTLAVRMSDGQARKHDITAAQLSSGITIGRDNKAGITVASTKLSREHVKIRLHDRKLTIEDLGSTNGGNVDGKKLTPGDPVQINSKSRIEVGDIQLKVNPS